MLVTFTLTIEPRGAEGVLQVIEVELTTTTLVAAEPPNVTVAPGWKPLPVMVTLVLPAGAPEIGFMLLTRTTEKLGK